MCKNVISKFQMILVDFVESFVIVKCGINSFNK